MEIKITQPFFLLCFAFFMGENIHAQSFEKYLKLNGVEINEAFIVDNVRFYLHRRYAKDKLHWHDGSIVSKKGVEYENLKLKFNTIDNTVNIKNNGKYYRIAPESMSGFIIYENGKKREFKKGFAEIRKHELSAVFDIDSETILKYIVDFEESDNFEITHLKIKKDENGRGQIGMTLASRSEYTTHAFRSYLSEKEGVETVEIIIKNTGLEPIVFFEILAQGEHGYLLKHFSKKSIESNSTNLAGHSYSVTFDEYDYYVANPEKEIKQVVFLKQSVKRSVVFLGLEPPQNLGPMRNEERLVRYMREIL